ncbi:MAG: hypothetical protein ACREH9_05875 [Pseudomonadota bacterium]
MKIRFDLLVLAFVFTGCFYAPMQHPLPVRRDRIEIALPYDLAWQAVRDVVARNRYRIIVEDPDHGLIETQAPGGFTLKDADCGKVGGIAGRFASEPDIDSSAVYNFKIAPMGNESSTVSVQATFTAPLHVPFHSTTSMQCVSRGYAEARLLKQIALHAREVHRPIFKPPE